MNIFKRVSVIFAGIIIFIYLLFLLAPLIISPILNAKREMISEMIKENTGFGAEISGITLVTSWNFSAGIKLKELKLALPDSDKAFFYSKDLGLKLSLLPFVGRKIQLDSLFADSVFADIIVKKDGKLQLLDYLPEQNGKPKKSFDMPFGLKLSNNLPSIYVNSYRLAVIDLRTDRSYFMEGEDFKVTNFVLDKRIKFSSKGKVVFDNTVISNYDLKLDNRVMPDWSLHDMVFPPDVALDDESASQSDAVDIVLTPVIDILEKVKQNKFSADVIADLNINGTPNSPVINGHLNFNGVSVAVDGKSLPKSNFDMIFKAHRTNIDSKFYTSHDLNEKTLVSGYVDSGSRKSLDLSVKSNAKFQNIINLVDSVAGSFNIDALSTLTATGSMDADFNIKSDFKKISSSGHLKVLPSQLNYGLYNVSIKNITADINMNDNNVLIKKAGFSVFDQPLNLSGSILSDATVDLKLIADKLSLKGLLVAFGQAGLLKENSVDSGTVSLNAIIKGKLNQISPELNASVNSVNIYNKPASARIALSQALAKVFYDGKTANGNVDVNTFALTAAGNKITVPQAHVKIDPDIINIQNAYVMLNNSRVDIKGNVKDYLNDKMTINLTADGAVQSAGIAAFLPKEFRDLITYKGQLPLRAVVSGNAKVQNIAVDMSANPNNYIALVDLSALKGQSTKIHSNIEIIGDTLNLSNTSLSNSKGNLATVSGNVTKLYSSPDLNLNISVPSSVSFPIWGLPSSSITANGHVRVHGNAMNPSMKGRVNISDISIKDMDLVISDLAADLSGVILNGSATAKKFKFGGIVATDIVGNFSLKDYTKFYLTDASAKAFEGNVTGKISYDIPTTKIGVEFDGSGLNSTNAVEGAVGIKNALTGKMGFDGKLTMQGVTDKELIKSMKGNINFRVEDGRFVSIGRLENLVAAQNVTSNSILKSAISALSTLATVQEADKFKSIKGEMTFASGIANIPKILVAGPLMSYYVNGSYNIIPNSANLLILGRLDSKIVTLLGPLGQLSAEKLLAYIPKFGAATASILNQLTSDPKSENTSLIPALSNGSTSYKDFKVVFNGPVGGASSVRSFKWLSSCDTSQIDIKKDLQSAQQAVKENITNKVEETKTKVENVQKNITTTVETQKAKVEQAKKDIEQAKADIQAIKENSKQSAENLKNLFQNVLKNSTQQIPAPAQSQTPASDETAPAAEPAQ